jgi:DNA-binding beta-propeller fold protein YncE
VVLANSALHAFRLGREPAKMGEPYTTAATVIAATNDGILVGTEDDQVKVLKIENDRIVEAGKQIQVKEVQDVAVDAGGTRAVVLHTCESEEGSCLTVFDIASPAPKETLLNATVGKGLVGMRADGKYALVVDEDAIYSVALEGDNAPEKAQTINMTVSSVWPEASTPVALAHSSMFTVQINKTDEDGKKVLDENGKEVMIDVVTDTFAILNAANNSVAIIAFDKTENDRIKSVTPRRDGETTNSQTEPREYLSLSESLGNIKPTALSFGRRGSLYLTAGTQVHQVNIFSGTLSDALFSLKSEPVSLAVQP